MGEIIQSDMSIFEKTQRILSMCYIKELPPTLEKAVEGIVRFYACEKAADTKSGKREAPIVDFSEDCGMIAAAFYHDYGIDLWKEDLHWWQFRELFASLGEENKIVKVMGYRSIDPGKVTDKEQKKFYRRMKKLYKLRDKRTEEEKQRDFSEELSDIFREV